MLKKQPVVLYKKEVCLGVRMKGVRDTRNRGISAIAKPLIDRMMKEDIECTAKQCHSMLMNSKKISATHLPKLFQVYEYYFFFLLALFFCCARIMYWLISEYIFFSPSRFILLLCENNVLAN